MTSCDSEPSGSVEDLALDFLEQWLADPVAHPVPHADPNQCSQEGSPAAEQPLNHDIGLLAIERLVSQHRELFRRHPKAGRS